MPRNYPGGYNLVLYDSFVENLHAFSAERKLLKTAKETDGPRWRIPEGSNRLQRVEYDIDVNRMEQDLPPSIDTSKAREGYLGILGYSVFGYIDGLQHRKIQLNVEAPKGWPVLTTLSPAVPASKANVSAGANDYDALADSQILMGLQEVKRQARISMDSRGLAGRVRLIRTALALPACRQVHKLEMQACHNTFHNGPGDAKSERHQSSAHHRGWKPRVAIGGQRCCT